MTKKRPASGRSVRNSLALVTAGGSLCMVFTAFVTNPAEIEFYRAIGARDIFFGLLGGIPMLTLFMQFIGAIISNRILTRKPLFMFLLIAARVALVPTVMLPFMFPSWDRGLVLGLMLCLVALRSALANLAPPVWFSWMADLIPHRILNSYWGARQQWMSLTWTATYVVVMALAYASSLPITTLFPLMVIVGVIAGVTDILLFIWVKEPQNVLMREETIATTFMGPLRHGNYRRFLIFSCVFSAAVMFSSVFMQVYCLEVLHMKVWQAAFIWCLSGLGTAVAARQWGRIADRHGHKPVLVICSFFKPLVVVALLLCTPELAMWVLPPMFLIDGTWNAGDLVANNGFMLKLAPRRNRSTFAAAIMGFSGLCGGISAIAAGVFLKSVAGFSLSAFGRDWNKYHLLFAIGVVLRIIAAAIANWLREPASSTPMNVLYDMRGIWPMRFIRFPIGLYRKYFDE